MPNWQLSAHALAQALPLEKLEPSAIAAIERAGGPLYVACSGGADSLVVLLLVWAHYPEKRDKLSVIHYNHRTRGVDADADAEFVKEVAGALELEYFYAEAPPHDKEPNEDELRTLRMGFINGIVDESSLLVSGHHADDVAETLLMRLARGAGTAGLAAPRPVQDLRTMVIARPLMTLSKNEIITVLTVESLPWREDGSNSESKYFRNRVRNKVMPLLNEISPAGFTGQTLRSRMLLDEDAAALDFWLDSFGLDFQQSLFPLNKLMSLPKAILRRALMRWLSEMGVLDSVTSKLQDELLETTLSSASKRFSAGDHTFILIQESAWSIEHVHPTICWNGLPLTMGGRVFGSPYCIKLDETHIDKVRILIQKREIDEWSTAFLDITKVSLPLIVCNAQAGESYRPLGAPGKRKIHDIWTDRKIPKNRKKSWPVIKDSKGDILWTPGAPPSHEHKVSDDTQNTICIGFELC